MVNIQNFMTSYRQQVEFSWKQHLKHHISFKPCVYNPLTTNDAPERHKGWSLEGYISHVGSYRYLVLLFSKTFGRGILSSFSQYLEFRAAPRLYVGVLELNRATRLFLVLLTPSRAHFGAIFVSGVPCDNSEINESSRAVFRHETLDWGVFLTSDSVCDHCACTRSS